MAGSAVKIQDRFTYGDYRHWPDEERWESIGGVPYSWRSETVNVTVLADCVIVLDRLFRD